MTTVAIDAPTPRTLDELRVEIEHEHAGAVEAYRDAVMHAIRAGELLLEAKKVIGHGGWLDWLEESFPATVRTAQNYMFLARHREDAQRVSHLGVGAALRALRAGDLAPVDAERVADELRLDEELPAALQCAAALQEVHDRALYAETFTSFAAYLRIRWGLEPRPTKDHLGLLEGMVAQVRPDHDRSLAECDEVIGPRRIAFDYVAWRVERSQRRKPPRPIADQMALPAVRGWRGSTQRRQAAAIHAKPSTRPARAKPSTWVAHCDRLLRQEVADRLDVGELVDGVIERADRERRALLTRDRGWLIERAQLHLDKAMRATGAGKVVPISTTGAVSPQAALSEVDGDPEQRSDAGWSR